MKTASAEPWEYYSQNLAALMLTNEAGNSKARILNDLVQLWLNVQNGPPEDSLDFRKRAWRIISAAAGYFYIPWPLVDFLGRASVTPPSKKRGRSKKSDKDEFRQKVVVICFLYIQAHARDASLKKKLLESPGDTPAHKAANLAMAIVRGSWPGLLYAATTIRKEASLSFGKQMKLRPDIQQQVFYCVSEMHGFKVIAKTRASS